MRIGKKITFGFFTVLFFSRCALIGIHFNVKNPASPGNYPKLKKAQVLLAKQTARRTCFDVGYYKLDLRLGEKRRLVSGSVLIVSKLVTTSDSLQIDLYKNLKISALLFNGEPAAFNRNEGAVFVKVPPAVSVGETFSLAISYAGTVKKAIRPPWKGGMSWKKDTEGKRWAGISCESEGASIWWPNKDDVSDEADSLDIRFTVPVTSNVVSNGTFKGETANNDRTKTSSWHVSYPINNYNVTFYLGNYKLIADTFVSRISDKIIPMSYYVLDKHHAVAKDHFQQVKQHLAFYETVFGNYPWPKDGYKLVESPYEGMEHQTAIAYGSKFKNNGDGFDYIILHETAHEWWGNSVTAADLSDVWLQEGFATYAEALFVESTKGRDAYLDYMYWQRVTIDNKRPLVKPRGIRYFSTDDEDAYGKGSWVLHSLRNTIRNDSVFFDIIRTFRNENHCKQVYTETFVKLVNEKTGQDYNWFFNQYVYTREAPMLEYYWFGDYVYYKWLCTGNDFNKLPVKITFGDDKPITVYPDVFLQKLEVRSTATKMYFSDREVYFGNVQNKALGAE